MNQYFIYNSLSVQGNGYAVTIIVGIKIYDQSTNPFWEKVYHIFPVGMHGCKSLCAISTYFGSTVADIWQY